MRILHLSSLYPPYTVGGAERVVQVVAEGSMAAGIEVAVAHVAPQALAPRSENGVDAFALRHRNPLWIGDSASYPGLVRNANKIATLFNLLTAADLERLIKDYRPDIVHSHSMVEFPPLMWECAKRHGARIVHTLHDYDLLCIRAALFKGDRRCTQQHRACAAFSRVKRHYHRHIDHVVGVSQAILDTHLGYGFFAELPAAQRHVVWNPVRASTAPLENARCRDGEPFTFGFLGRLVAEKGVTTLIDACRLLPSQGWQLRIAGRAPRDDADLRQRAAGLPIEFLGHVDPAGFFREIDLLVVPSAWLEPFGLTIVEAYAAGVEVLGTDIGGVAEIIGAVDHDRLVPPDNARALAAKMAAMMVRGRRAGSPQRFANVLARTDPAHVVRRYLDIYRAAGAGPKSVA